MKPKILFVCNLSNDFLRVDIRILSEFADVRVWNTQEEGFNPFSLISAIQKADLLYIWFASLHALLPAFLGKKRGKKVILVSGGYDIANVDEIKYGHRRSGFKKRVAGLVLGWADRIVVNAASAYQELQKMNPGFEQKSTVIHHGLDIPSDFTSTGKNRDEKLLINVSYLNRLNFKRKKIDLIKEIARMLPEYRVVHIGKIDPEMKKEFHQGLPDNMESRGYVGHDELWDWYNKAGFLLAPSWHEGFGITTVEALAAGCIPLISGTGAQEEVTMGFAVKPSSEAPEAWIKSIKETVVSDSERKSRMEKIRLAYNMDKRKTGLKNLISGLLNGREE